MYFQFDPILKKKPKSIINHKSSNLFNVSDLVLVSWGWFQIENKYLLRFSYLYLLRKSSLGLDGQWLPKQDDFMKYLLMPCPSTGPKLFCAGPNFLCKVKNLIAFSASSKTFVPAQKLNLLNENHLLVWHKMFVTSAICISSFDILKIWTSPK